MVFIGLTTHRLTDSVVDAKTMLVVESIAAVNGITLEFWRIHQHHAGVCNDLPGDHAALTSPLVRISRNCHTPRQHTAFPYALAEYRDAVLGRPSQSPTM
jgi:hypothetical protein